MTYSNLILQLKLNFKNRNIIIHLILYIQKLNMKYEICS